jgi:hypothetical protein
MTHLEAHEGASKYATRCSSIADIFWGTASSATACRCDASLASHFTFVMGHGRFELSDQIAGHWSWVDKARWEDS